MHENAFDAAADAVGLKAGTEWTDDSKIRLFARFLKARDVPVDDWRRFLEEAARDEMRSMVEFVVTVAVPVPGVDPRRLLADVLQAGRETLVDRSQDPGWRETYPGLAIEPNKKWDSMAVLFGVRPESPYE